jgi:hypothetical protein
MFNSTKTNMKLKILKTALAIVAGLVALDGVVQAEPVAVSNYSFENPALSSGGVAYAPLLGWNAFGGGYQQIYNQLASDGFYTQNGDGTLAATGDGYQYFSVNGGAAGGPGGIDQDVGQLLPNTTYTLTVAVGWRNGIPNGISNIKLVNGGDNTGVTLASTNVDITTLTSGTFSDVTLVYTTGPSVSGDLTIVLQSTTGVQANFDNVRLDAQIPSFGTSVTVSNFSFENPALTYPVSNPGFVPSWIIVNDLTGQGVGEADISGNYNIYFAGDGTNYLPASGDGYQIAFITNGASIYQDVGALLPSKTYTMLVAVGADPADNPSLQGSGQIQLINGTDNTGTVLAATKVSNVGASGVFRNYLVSFTTPSSVSGHLTVALNTTNATKIIYDNVRLYQAAPTLSVGAPVLSSTTAYPGKLVTISASAGGGGTLEYNFQYDSGTAGTTWTSLSGYSTNSSYVDNTTGYVLGNYEYRVVVTNVYAAITSAPAMLTVANVGPDLVQNPAPFDENLVVGQSVNFTAVFNSTLPITYQWQVNRNDGNGFVNVTNGTPHSAALIINNLAVADAGTYSVIATHTYGSTTNTTSATLAVAPVPSPDSFGNLVLLNNESGNGSFTSTYSTAAGLIAGMLPFDQAGNFSGPGYDSTGGNITNITSGQAIIGGDKSLMVTVGDAGGNTNNAGQYVTYLLNTNASPQGYNLTSLQAIGGWSDYGRDEVTADVYYSTVSNPTTFIQFAFYDNNPATGVSPPVNRVVVLPSSGYLAQNVAAVKFSFTPTEKGGTVQNGYVGLFKLGVYGQAVTPPSLHIAQSGSNVVLTWTGGTLYQASSLTGSWTVVTGATSPWTIAPTAPQMLYRLQ